MKFQLNIWQEKKKKRTPENPGSKTIISGFQALAIVFMNLNFMKIDIVKGFSILLFVNFPTTKNGIDNYLKGFTRFSFMNFSLYLPSAFTQNLPREKKKLNGAENLWAYFLCIP